LTDDLLKIGRAVGEYVETQRRKDIMADLRKRLHVPNLSEADMTERSLDAALLVMPGAKEAHLFTYNSIEKETVDLITRYPKSKIEERKYDVTIADIYHTLLQSENTFKPHIIPENNLLEWVCIELSIPSNYMWRNNVQYNRLFVAIIRNIIPNALI
jgi:hypothetical protein